jgi:hypothetical protein
MKERPLLLNGEMVRATLDERKTHHCLPIADNILNRFESLDPDDFGEGMPGYETEDGQLILLSDFCPFGQVGDRLWVRETFCKVPGYKPIPSSSVERHYDGKEYFYRADNDRPTWASGKWTPSVQMPRAASRISLEVVSTGFKLLQNISEEEAIAEGIESIEGSGVWKNYQIAYPSGWFYLHRPIDSFRTLWDSIYAEKHPWEANKLVWVGEYKVLEVKP